jgi:serine/threonine protein kinase
MTSIATVGSKVGRCLSFLSFLLVISADCITKILHQGGGGFVYVAKDSDTQAEVVLKLILLGPKGSESRSANKKLIEREMKIGLIFAKESEFLVSYLEIFESEDYFCIKMEYCILGDLQHQLDNSRVFTEKVY